MNLLLWFLEICHLIYFKLSHLPYKIGGGGTDLSTVCVWWEGGSFIPPPSPTENENTKAIKALEVIHI